MLFLIYAMFIIITVTFVKGFKIIKPDEVGIVMRLGKLKQPVLEPGFHVINPFFDRIVLVITKEVAMNIQSVNCITRDNIEVLTDIVVHYKIVDPVKAVYAVSDLSNSIRQITQTTTKNIAESMNSKEVLSSRSIISSRLQDSLSTAVAPWGVDVSLVDINVINLSQDDEKTLGTQFAIDNESNDNIDSTNHAVDDVEEILRRAREASKID